MNTSSPKEFLTGYLLAKNVTQSDIAGELGVTRQTISAKLRDADKVNIPDVVQLAFAAGVVHARRSRLVRRVSV